MSIEKIAAHRTQFNREAISSSVWKAAVVLVEISAVTSILGRGLKYVARELGHDAPRRLRFPID